MTLKLFLTALMLGVTLGGSAMQKNDGPRARDIGLTPGVLPTGSLKAITGVAGVQVGQTTIRHRSNRTIEILRKHGALNK